VGDITRPVSVTIGSPRRASSVSSHDTFCAPGSRPRPRPSGEREPSQALTKGTEPPTSLSRPARCKWRWISSPRARI
jgi:hypothetical protein